MAAAAMWLMGERRLSDRRGEGHLEEEEEEERAQPTRKGEAWFRNITKAVWPGTLPELEEAFSQGSGLGSLPLTYH
ncbi:hypothetical protein LTR86_010755 [Recurvomyces mirabilis]|nr:hypothetical protein LTR86_010755 [Recurvomyces mirabilis]